MFNQLSPLEVTRLQQLCRHMYEVGVGRCQFTYALHDVDKFPYKFITDVSSKFRRTLFMIKVGEKHSQIEEHEDNRLDFWFRKVVQYGRFLITYKSERSQVKVIKYIDPHLASELITVQMAPLPKKCERFAVAVTNLGQIVLSGGTSGEDITGETHM